MDYSLEIISHLPQFKGQRFVQHYVNGMNTIGVWGNEGYEIRFSNNSTRKVQLRLSIDGTDILTGEKATLDPQGKMWVVEAQQTLGLQAWPETTHSGARFVFASGGDAATVAHNIHGDLSNKGIIGAAVFTDGNRNFSRTSVVKRKEASVWPSKPLRVGAELLAARMEAKSAAFDNNNNMDFVFDRSREMSAPGTGAGETIDQTIKSTVGLIKPTFYTIVNLRYIWWDDLKMALQSYKPLSPTPNGFFVSPEELFIDLKNTPKIEPIRIYQ